MMLWIKYYNKIFKIKYSDKLLNCTYFGKQWWGDQISGKWLGKKIISTKITKDKKIKYNLKIIIEFIFRKV